MDITDMQGIDMPNALPKGFNPEIYLSEENNTNF